MNIKKNANSKYLLCEQNWVYYTLIAVSGFWGAFTYLLRGNVFCNAQTGNVVLLGLAIGSGQIYKAIYYLIPIFAYVSGAFISEILPNPIKHRLHIRWDTLLVGMEIIVVILLGFLPDTFPVQVSQIAINFIASMQYNTFRQAQGTPMATTFATNHIRQVGIGLAMEVKHWKKADKSHRTKLKKHSLMLLFFLMGCVIGTVFCHLIQGRAIWATAVPLFVLFCMMIRDDKVNGSSHLEQKPLGH